MRRAIYEDDVIKLLDKGWKTGVYPVASNIHALPPAKPDIIHCKDCKWKNQHNCTRAVELFIDDDKYCAWAERKT